MRLQSKAWLLLTASITLQILLARSVHRIPHGRGGALANSLTGTGQGLPADHAQLSRLYKRASHNGQHPYLPLPQLGLDDKSTPVDTPSVFDFPYKEWYDRASPTARPFVLFGLVCILAFLFGFIGISASDFFCPNLSTIAAVLGLNESTAGVTFLAFGNGSPDVFSTFAALNNGTFGLAVGELIGAASFIVSVVVGSIALIRPFHVPRFPFLRDTLFFTLAVVLLIVVLHDGHLTILESGSMVLLYIAYVAVVISANMYNRKRPLTITHTLTPSPQHPSPDASPVMAPTPEDEDVQRANFSLLTAIEFRDVVQSLQRENRDGNRESRSPSPQRTPVASRQSATEGGGDYFGSWHRRSISHDFTPVETTQGRRRSASYTRHTSIGGARMARQLGLSPLVPTPGSPNGSGPSTPTFDANYTLQVPILRTPQPRQTGPTLQVPNAPSIPNIPSIHVIDPAGYDSCEPDTPSPVTPSGEWAYRLRATYHALFPTLRDFGEKSWVGRAIGVFSVPAVLVLTLTLPVVEGSDMEGGVSLPTHMNEPLQPTAHSHSLPLSQSFASDLSPSPKEMIHVESEISRFSPALTAAQCIFGPTFCVAFVFGDSDQLVYLLMATVIAGLVGAVGVINAAQDGKSPGWRLVRCMAGFVCSMVWIAAIANEVVSVLLALGEIMGLSEAIIGLTIFAIGNSLADLVANVTVAQFAPTMAYAACFGGPMLNLLLGIGGSGSYGILISRQSVNIHFSPTLWVSASGLVAMLLATAVFVPLNGYLIDRRWAVCLIVAYGVLMSLNVVVELKMGRG